MKVKLLTDLTSYNPKFTRDAVGESNMHEYQREGQPWSCLLYTSGIAGEKNVAFELKNSGMPMYILHDLSLIHI